MSDSRNNFEPLKKYRDAIIKVKHAGIILNWSNPRRHVNDELLRFVFREKLGINIPHYSYDQAFTIEEFAYCLDQLGLIEEKKDI